MRVCYAFGWCVVFKKRYPMLDKLGQIVWQTRQHCLIILILIFHFVPTITFYRVSNSLVASADAFLLILSFAFHFIWQRNVLRLFLLLFLSLSLFVGACALTRTVCIFQIHSLLVFVHLQKRKCSLSLCLCLCLCLCVKQIFQLCHK